jgi:hypothetical protein
MSSIVQKDGCSAAGDDSTGIECHADVVGYFHEQVVAAMRERRVEATLETELYLVRLLTDALALGGPELGLPLVDLYAKALEAKGRARLSGWKTLGDRALYLAGFFDEYLARRGLSRRYFAQMGGSAYNGASRLAERSDHIGDRARAPVFRDLGGRFVAFAGVIDAVREATTFRTEGDVLTLYERWRRSRSPALAAKLGRHGVFPGRSGASRSGSGTSSSGSGGPLH